MAEIEVAGLTKVYPNGVRALENLDLTIADGEFFALLGPSGCGKTTLLRTLAGLEAPTKGTIRIGGRDVTRLPPGPRHVAMVFQDYALYPHMDVADNIAYPLKIRKMAKAQRRQRAAETGANLGLGELMERRPAQLSGGQQQRVAVARAIACDAQVLLFDEPLSNLDARLRMEARTFLKRLHAELATTTVYVTHDQAEALALADRMAVMEHGVIRQLGSPVEVFHRPANLFVATFIGNTPMNLLPAVVEDGGLLVGPDRVPLPPETTGEVAEGEQVIFATRPEYMTIGPDGGEGMVGEVVIVEDLGTNFLVSIEGASGMFQVIVPEDSPPRRGQRVMAVGDWSRALLYRQPDGSLIASPPTPAASSGAGGQRQTALVQPSVPPR